MPGIEFTVEESGKLTGTRNGKTYTGKAGVVESQLDMLKEYVGDGRVPSEDLLWDIRLYEFILNAENPEKMAHEYLSARHPEDGWRSKREVVELLGWDVP